MSDAPLTVAPNDPAIAAGLATNLNGLIDEFNSYVSGWQQRVDAVIVQIQNAGESTEVAGGVTGQVPGGVVPQPEPTGVVDTPPEPSTEPTGSSTPDDIGSTPPEDTTTGTTHDFLDPSNDDTILDPSGDDRTL